MAGGGELKDRGVAEGIRIVGFQRKLHLVKNRVATIAYVVLALKIATGFGQG